MLGIARGELVDTEIEVVTSGSLTELVVIGSLVVDTTGMDTGMDSSLSFTALGSRCFEDLLDG
jgi:hypothetical protein